MKNLSLFSSFCCSINQVTLKFLINYKKEVVIMRKDIYELEYNSKLDLIETQKAIKFVKDTFQKYLVKELNLLRVSAPLFVEQNSGLNDSLNGVERPIDFSMINREEKLEIVHSLAKWKRMALGKYHFEKGTGLYTDMNAIRRDENLDFYHSLYVDQWDWERVMTNEERKYSYLKRIVKKVYKAIYLLQKEVTKKYPQLNNDLPKEISFISTKELEKRYPDLSRKEREDQICREEKAVFIYQIGWPLKDKMPHDGRAPDYDDWLLNGDILLYYPLYDMGLELSSMGIRVNKESLVKQLKYKNEEEKLNNDFCKSILNDTIPLSIGGGIGQSRLCMYMLQKAHIGEVQASFWPKEEIEKLSDHHIFLL